MDGCEYLLGGRSAGACACWGGTARTCGPPRALSSFCLPHRVVLHNQMLDGVFALRSSLQVDFLLVALRKRYLIVNLHCD